MRALLIGLAVATAMAVAPADAHGTICTGHERFTYNTAQATGEFSFDLDRCTGSGTMQLELVLRRGNDAPVTRHVSCAPETMCIATVSVSHPLVEVNTTYTLAWRYTSDGSIALDGSGQKVVTCGSVLVRHGCPLALP